MKVFSTFMVKRLSLLDTFIKQLSLLYIMTFHLLSLNNYFLKFSIPFGSFSLLLRLPLRLYLKKNVSKENLSLVSKEAMLIFSMSSIYVMILLVLSSLSYSYCHFNLRFLILVSNLEKNLFSIILIFMIF